MPEPASTFGRLLREFRTRAGLSQGDLAEKASISEAAVSALERGARKVPYPNTVVLLSRALELTAQEAAALEGARQSARSKPGSGATHNLRAERTSFVGREDDLEHILELLARCRLVTITGSGGVGKTRAALEAAHVLGDTFPEVWFVDLAPLTDGDLIVAKIVQTLKPPLGDRADTVPALAFALAARHMLLILDNCEHVIADAAHVVDTILGGCPNITILATSRERLDVAGEFVYRLPSLSFPVKTPDSVDAALGYSAIELFIERAQAADPYRTLDSVNLPAVVDTVRRLDGIPLAIELTAAQVPFLGLEALRDRLYENVGVPSGRRDLPGRQQTVDATIRWSFDLLTEAEQTLLCESAVFVGGFTLAAAEAVCAHDSTDGSSVLRCVSALVSKSLVGVDHAHDTVRYALLESVRAFGLARLREAGTSTATVRRHAEWFANLADEHEREYSEMSQEFFNTLLPDLDNMRSAIAWSLGAPQQEDRGYAGRIVGGFGGVWRMILRQQEHRQLLEAALKQIDVTQHPRVVSQVLRNLIISTATETATLGLIDRAIRLSDQVDEGADKAQLHVILTTLYRAHGMLNEAERSAERASELLLSEGLQDSMLYAHFLMNRLELRLRQGRLDDARSDLAAAEAIARALGNSFFVVCYCYYRHSTIEYAAGNWRAALDYAERMIEGDFRTYPIVAALALERIAALRLVGRDAEGAAQPLREYILLIRNGDTTRSECEYAALFLALRNRGVDAARLLGCVRSAERLSAFTRRPVRVDAIRLLYSLLEEQLSPEACAAAEAEGALWTADEAMSHALAALE